MEEINVVLGSEQLQGRSCFQSEKTGAAEDYEIGVDLLSENVMEI
jgi:hypothetical protein